MNYKPRREIEERLPWVAAARLPPDDSIEFEEQLKENPELAGELAQWRTIKAALQSHPLESPPGSVWESILEKTETRRSYHRTFERLSISWFAGIALAIIVLASLWWIIRPGIELQWTVTGSPPESYRIYRAVSGSSEFNLIQEISSDEDTSRYRYVDMLLLPGRSYSYRVEGVGQVGEVAVSQMITIPPMAALPGQLAVIFTSLAAGYCAVMLLRYRQVSLAGRRPGFLI